jgi:hypothetical protein
VIQEAHSPVSASYRWTSGTSLILLSYLKRSIRSCFV